MDTTVITDTGIEQVDGEHDYHALNALLNLYDADGHIQFEADRKAAKEAEKQRAREQRASQRAAADRGEESALPARDRGPERRYIRDRVDSRLCMGEIVMPFMVLILVIWIVPNKTVQTFGMLIAWAALLAFAVDSFFMWRGIRKGLLAKFGAVPANSGKYAIMRGFQMRRTRFPKPMVKRGEKIV